ncbi:CBS domain-containing protein [Halobellus rufus]|uniref:CBS domain-containing protein n=1 Tax=Halobellus rufus TaxID=1448860 RepID=UPI000679D12B|nr:CBS domain-containing protein [Halobellus rufus]
MPVTDVSRTGVMTANREQSAGNLTSVMKEEDVGSVIIEEDDRPVGVVTDRDLVLEVLEPRADPTEVTAGDIMTDAPVTVSGDTGVFETIRQMHEHAVRRMPVTDESDALTGIVTLDDLVVLLADELDNLAGVIESESPPY